MPDWKPPAHLEDHFGQHRHEFPGHSLEAYDASAKETIAVGVEFTYIDRPTRLRRKGYFHRDSSRFTALDTEGFINTHFHTDEAYVADLIGSTYKD
jgi:hypothetical protein